MRFAVDGAKRMHRLIDAIMSYSKSARPGVVSSAVDANAVLGETLTVLAAQIAESGARITRAVLPEVRVDPAQLGQVFQNLIGNALKFSTGRIPEIAIGAVERDDQCVFSVADNGLGIDDAAQEHVFEMFRRHHPQEDIPGTGIGLATCRKIIENHDGRIWLESSVGVGTTFFFSLPKALPAGDAPVIQADPT